jgi:DNA uptake protein ComE-like DNA-binding protein
MKRGNLTKSHASGVVILIFTVLFVQGVLFLFSREELELRRPLEKIEEQKEGKEMSPGKIAGDPGKRVSHNSPSPVARVKTDRSVSCETRKENSGDVGKNAAAGKNDAEQLLMEGGMRTVPERFEGKNGKPADIKWSGYCPDNFLQLNTADSSDLVSLPGIGPYYAKKILAYRDKLGGFASREQLLEISGIDRERYGLFADRVTADTNLLKRVSIQEATYEQLARNPYIGGYLARAIIRFRDENKDKAIDLLALATANIIKKELYKILKFYFH